jgi:xeroderma pigmentosum group C-complementing protein
MTLWLLTKSMDSRTLLDDREDDQLMQSQVSAEKMPTSFAGFSNHPIYALERHCKTNEAIWPLGPEHSVGIYKGEAVYPRSSVHKVLFNLLLFR